ncbi:MAG TPA: hypothetical protein EYQ60_15525 [Myxococcales bacterium]|nr:hypothetical protein [Myxococcales bacterium]HIK85823.1 hypothetical protein [Myxococcales bacterium]
MQILQLQEPRLPANAPLIEKIEKKGNSMRLTPFSVFLLAIASPLFAIGCQPTGSLDIVESGYVPVGAVAPEDLLVVDCLLPGQIRKLGRSQVYMTPRRALETSGLEKSA